MKHHHLHLRLPLQHVQCRQRQRTMKRSSCKQYCHLHVIISAHHHYSVRKSVSRTAILQCALRISPMKSSLETLRRHKQMSHKECNWIVRRESAYSMAMQQAVPSLQKVGSFWFRCAIDLYVVDAISCHCLTRSLINVAIFSVADDTHSWVLMYDHIDGVWQQRLRVPFPRGLRMRFAHSSDRYAAWSANIITCATYFGILLLDSNTCAPMRTYAKSFLISIEDRKLPTAMLFSPTDANMLVTCHYDTLLVWNVREGTSEKLCMDVATKGPISFCVGFDGRLYVASYHSPAYCVDIASKAVLWKSNETFPGAVKLIWHDGIVIVVGFRYNTVVLDASTGDELCRLPLHKVVEDVFLYIVHKTGSYLKDRC